MAHKLMQLSAQGEDQALRRPLLQALQPRRVLVFRALQLGDMLCSVPALRALRAALPTAHITLVGLPWAAQFAQRFAHLVDDFIAFPGHPHLPEQDYQPALLPAFCERLEQASFDLAIQLHGSGEQSNPVVASFGAKAVAGFAASPAGGAFMPWPEQGHEVLRLLRLMEFLGAPSQGSALEFPITDEDREELHASGLAAGLTAGRYVCVHPGARWRDKCWPPAAFAAVADRIAQDYGLQVVLTGSHKEADLTGEVMRQMKYPAIDTASPLSIGAMAALIQDACLLLSNDTGVSHIAAGFGLKSVVIFNKADMERWAPLDRQRHRCLRDLEGDAQEAVWQQVQELLD